MNIENFCHIIRDSSFEDSVNKISKSHQRLSELDNWFDWLFERFDEEQFSNDKIDKDYYAWHFDRNDVCPEIRIIFKYDKASHTITLVDIEEIIEK